MIIWIAAGLLSAAGTGFGLWQWLRARRIVRRMDRMLSCAIDEGFCPEQFDESAVSSLESKLNRFLRGSATAQASLSAQQQTVQTLISDIAHQTRTPMSNILLYASLLEEQPLPPEQREVLGTLRQQAEKLSFLIESLMKSSRLESGMLSMTPRRQPVSRLLDQAAAQMRPAAQARGIDLRSHPADGLAYYDFKWSAEALGNVLDNAVKYTPSGGTITLRAAEYEMFCRIDVADTGPGVPEEEQAKIFSRFYRGQAVREQEGLGIGLYLTREILQRQGGYIRVSNRPGTGSVFSLYLPREAQAAPICQF